MAGNCIVWWTSQKLLLSWGELLWNESSRIKNGWEQTEWLLLSRTMEIENEINRVEKSNYYSDW